MESALPMTSYDVQMAANGLKKHIQCASTHNYTKQWYTSVQNWHLCFHSPIAYSTAVKGVVFGLSVDSQHHTSFTDLVSVWESVEPSARSSLLGQYDRESVVQRTGREKNDQYTDLNLRVWGGPQVSRHSELIVFRLNGQRQ